MLPAGGLTDSSRVRQGEGYSIEICPTDTTEFCVVNVCCSTSGTKHLIISCLGAQAARLPHFHHVKHQQAGRLRSQLLLARQGSHARSSFLRINHRKNFKVCQVVPARSPFLKKIWVISLHQLK